MFVGDRTTASTSLAGAAAVLQVTKLHTQASDLAFFTKQQPNVASPLSCRRPNSVGTKTRFRTLPVIGAARRSLRLTSKV